MLIAERLALLEQSSHQNFCSKWFWKLIGVQAVSFTIQTLLSCGYAVWRLSDSFVYAPAEGLAASAGLTTVSTWLCNMLASIWVAIKELKLSYHIGETLLFTIYTHYGNLI